MKGGEAASQLRIFVKKIGSMARRGVLRKLDVVDDAVDDFRLGQLDLAVVLLLDIDTQVILDVSLVFHV